MKKKNTSVAYQNKDIASKLFAENMREKSFVAYGLDLPPIVDVLPTNLPTIEANELRIDNLFRLADGSLALVDYESSLNPSNWVKYVSYTARLFKRYMGEIKDLRIRLIVIFTADIAATNDVLDLGCLTLRFEPVFLSRLDTEGIAERLSRKIMDGEKLDDIDLMQLIILPLAYRKTEDKRNQIEKSVELARKITDEGQQTFALSGLLVFCDKVIDKELTERIVRWISMTKVAQYFENEKIKAVEDKAKEVSIKHAQKMLKQGQDATEVAKIIDDLTLDEIKGLQSRPGA